MSRAAFFRVRQISGYCKCWYRFQKNLPFNRRRVHTVVRRFGESKFQTDASTYCEYNGPP